MPNPIIVRRLPSLVVLPPPPPPPIGPLAFEDFETATLSGGGNDFGWASGGVSPGTAFISRTFTEGAKEGLKLNTQGWARTLAGGNQWSKIRIGLLWAYNATGSIAGGFSLGVCSGTSKPFNDGSTTNFVGCTSTGCFDLWSANSGNPCANFHSSTADVICTRVAGVNATGGNFPDGVGIGMPTTSAPARKGVLYFDIAKGSPNYTLTMFGPLQTSLGVNFTLADLLSGMTQTPGITVGGQVLSFGNGPLTIACSEAAGNFDTINFCSTTAVGNEIELYAVRVHKFS